jgi:hypothetical protein
VKIGLLVLCGQFPLAPDKEAPFHDGNVKVFCLDPREFAPDIKVLCILRNVYGWKCSAEEGFSPP